MMLLLFEKYPFLKKDKPQKKTIQAAIVVINNSA
jgi:hypothetical protein